MKKTVKQLLGELYDIVGELEALYPGRPFTPDGHLVGSLGECLVAEAYGLSLMPPSNTGFDALAPDGTQVEIKATQGTKVSFRSCPQHAIVVTLDRQGGFEEVYNGRGEVIWECFRNRSRPSNGQYQISITKLKLLQQCRGEKIEMVNG